MLKGEENPVKKEGIGGDLSSLGAGSSGLSLQSLLGTSQPDLKPKPDLLSTALSSSGTCSQICIRVYKLRHSVIDVKVEFSFDFVSFFFCKLYGVHVLAVFWCRHLI